MIETINAARLDTLIGLGHVVVLLAREQARGTAVAVAVMRVLPSLWSNTQEAYLAEFYVRPSRRGLGNGRGLITKAIRAARTAKRHLRLPHHQSGR